MLQDALASSLRDGFPEMPRDMFYCVASNSASGPPSLLSIDTMALSLEYGGRSLKLNNLVQLICR